jgi:hypothetical protein
MMDEVHKPSDPETKSCYKSVQQFHMCNMWVDVVLLLCTLWKELEDNSVPVFETAVLARFYCSVVDFLNICCSKGI